MLNDFFYVLHLTIFFFQSPLGHIIMDIISAPKLENDLIYLKAKVQPDLIEKVDVIIDLVQSNVDSTGMPLKKWYTFYVVLFSINI